MGRLLTKAAKYEHIKYDRLLTEQCIGRLNDKGIMYEILREVAMFEDIKEATSEHVLTWA